MNKKIMQQAYLNEIFDYIDGNLYWKIQTGRNVKIGAKAGCFDKSLGYVKVSVKGKQYGAHRLIFLMHHGYLPKIIDHKNSNRSDNRIENLREATFVTNAQNCKKFSNNKTGIKGVFWREIIKKYVASISVNGKRILLGNFLNLEDAANEVKNAREKYHKEFVNHG